MFTNSLNLTPEISDRVSQSDQILSLSNMNWSDYEQIVEKNTGYRASYFDGIITFSSPNRNHERIAETINGLIKTLALNGATILLADALQTKNIAVYAMCPGWVKTDMGGYSAPRTPEQGADTAILLATEATIQESGKFFRDRTEQSYL